MASHAEDLENYPAPDVFSSACSSRAVVQHLTGRWAPLIMVALQQDGVLRFGELRRRIDGISDKMLSHTLLVLERDGLVQRTEHSIKPPNVDYQLTALGQQVSRPLLALIETVEATLPQVIEAQQTYDAGQGA